MNIQAKKTFAIVNYKSCHPKSCDPQQGLCAAVPACTHKVVKQIDGPFESPAIFQDLCMGCWDCIAACPLDAIGIKQLS